MTSRAYILHNLPELEELRAIGAPPLHLTVLGNIVDPQGIGLEELGSALKALDLPRPLVRVGSRQRYGQSGEYFGLRLEDGSGSLAELHELVLAEVLRLGFELETLAPGHSHWVGAHYRPHVTIGSIEEQELARAIAELYSGRIIEIPELTLVNSRFDSAGRFMDSDPISSISL